jgi:farnesyl diphosphate synthase
MLTLGQWMESHGQRIEAALDALLPAANELPRELHEAMRYASLGGGKRIRPMLVYAAGQSFGAPAAVLDAAACAVECIHAYSLVHDDLPCMDDDALRRGKPTVHLVYGEAQAMLVGDALQALAFESLAGEQAGQASAPQVVKMVRILARAAGSRGMAGGQALDIAATGAPLDAASVETMHRLKTGALLVASVQLGAACSPASDPWAAALERFAQAIGLAFQVVDDILDVASDSATLGKTAGKDAQHNKPTYVSVLGLEAAKAMADRLRDEAHEALADMRGAGLDVQRLAELADLICQRRN